MREQLIQLLIGETAPAIAEEGLTPVDALVKTARANNLSPELARALGQLYNTAISVQLFEKTASASERQTRLPLVEPEEVVSKLVELEPVNVKQAAAVTPEVQQSPITIRDAFAMAVGHDDDDTVFSDGLVKVAAQAPGKDPQVVLEELEQLSFDATEDAREMSLRLWSKLAATGQDFADLEAIAMRDEDLAYTASWVANHITNRNGECIKRASAPARMTLVPQSSELNQLVDIHKKLAQAARSRLMYRSLWTKVAAGVPNAVEEMEKEAPKDGADSKITPLRKALSVNFTAPDEESGAGIDPEQAKGMISGVGDWLSKGPVGQAHDAFIEAGKGALQGGGDGGQQVVDDAHRDAVLTSVIQDLMLNDEVVAEADPERVSQILTSILSHMPQMAQDREVLKGTLRAALQHDAMSPFDAKQLLDAEESKLKTQQRAAGKSVAMAA